MKTQKNPGLGARTSSVSAALATSEPAEERIVATSVRLPSETYNKLLDMVTAGKKRGEKLSLHSLILEGIALRIGQGE